MKIWIVNHYATPLNMGGMVRHYYFSKYLKKMGHQVKIFTSSVIHNSNINMITDKSLYKEEVFDDVKFTFVKGKEYKGNGIDRIWNLIDTPFEICKVMKIFYKTEKPDVIYTSSPDIFVSFFAVHFAKKRKIPVVMEVRDLWPESVVEYNGMSRNNPIVRCMYQMEKWIYKKSDRIIFTMEGGKQYIIDKGWDKEVNLDKVEHVNNGVDLKEFENNLKKYTVDDENLNDDTKFKVVYIGSIRKANNIQELVNAAEELKNRNESTISFLIYGEGNDKEELEQECKKRSLDNIYFKGFIDKKYIPYVLSKSNLNILNYKKSATWKYGGSQNKLFEYLASGRPICSNVKMGYSLIEEYDCGIEEDICSAKQYADIILSYKNMDVETYHGQCERARKAALEKDYLILSEKIRKILQEIVKE